MKKYLFLIIILICFQIINLIAATLYVIDPRLNGSPKQNASIEDFKVIIKPQGLYTEYGLYFTISDSCATGKRFKPFDTLEIVMPFDLPKEAIVNDMWLRMDNGTWVKALIFDRWTARLIYETTVQRAWDPSLLLKNGQGKYELRVFPLAEGHSRQVKINYLLPNSWYSGQVSSVLPFDFLKASSNPCKTVSLIAYPNSEFSVPAIPDHPEITFYDGTASGFPNALRADLTIQQAGLLAKLTLNYNADMSKPFTSISKYPDKSYYQLRVPVNIDNSKINGKKICIILDHENGKTTLDYKAVLSALTSNLNNKLIPQDSINIVFYSKGQCKSVSENWIASDSLSIAEAFSKVDFNPLTSTSKLDTLLYYAVDVMNKQKDSGLIFVVTNSDIFGDRDVGNNIINTLLKRLINDVTFSTVSYLNTGWRTYFIANIAYAGNDYLYFNLTRMTRGIMNKIVDNANIFEQISNNLNSSLGKFENFTVNISADNGFVYNTFSEQQAGSSISDIIITQSGILYGDIPLTADVSFQFRKIVYFQKLKITNDELSKERYNDRQIFAGKYIYSMEIGTPDYNKISDIVLTSMDYRVLSIYTGFLCIEVEPEEQNDTSTTSNDASTTLSIDGISISVSPMPVVDNAIINIRIKDEYKNLPITLELFNSYGSIIKNFSPGIIAGMSEYKLSWDAKDNKGDRLDSGVYFLVLRINGIRIVYKVIVL